MSNGRLILLCLLAGLGCAPKKVCECAVYVGGTTPATEEEERARSRQVHECLEKHGGGTINGCPMPPSVQR